jgi:hypothetical protein
LLVIWGSLYLWFQYWRAGYRDRAALGARIVGPTIDPLAKVIPPTIEPALWVETVADTHGLLDRLTSSGVLNKAQMQELHTDLAARVGRARPETALLEMIHLWTDLRLQAGPVVSDVPYPALLELSAILDPVASTSPPDTERNTWAQAVDQTRLMLVAVRVSGQLDAMKLRNLERTLALRLGHAQRGMPRGALAGIWDDAAAQAPGVVASMPRPAIITRATAP